ncbi:MAG: hypothetical protein ACTHJ8_13575 [Mucilaginibacter sp.]
MSKIRKLLKALSGTISWNFRAPKTFNTGKGSIDKKSKQENDDSASGLKENIA